MRYGFGSSTACANGSVSKTDLAAEVTAAFDKHRACLNTMGISTTNTLRSMPTARGRVVLAAITNLQTIFGVERVCLTPAEVAVIRELLAVIGILCMYPETIETLRTCQKQVADSQIVVRKIQAENDANAVRIKQLLDLQRELEGDVHELSQRPESCAPCAAQPPPGVSMQPPPPPELRQPAPQQKGVSFGVAIGGAVAAGALGYAATRMFSRRKKG